jgi:bisphosphoglycerate-dependent phosphoglycerate mutase
MNALPKNLELPHNIALILRHAERYPITNLADAFDACLTEKGKTDAYLFGQIFKQYNMIKLYHSPVLRCKQTAESISSGILSLNQKAIVVGHLLELGAPFITTPWESIIPLIEQHGYYPFIRKWFNNELPPDFIMPLELAAQSQLHILIKQLKTADSSTINITHDWNIMILREYYFNLKHENIGEPGYLDGLCAYIRGESLHLFYNEQKKIIDMSAV